MLHGEDGQQEDINEPTDEEARDGGTEEAKKLTAQKTTKVRGILSLENGQVDLTLSKMQLLANANVIASMKVIRYGVSLKVIQSKRNFMVLICKQLMFLKFNGGRYVV